ncbi:hypothetical protein H8K00_13445 [Clostridium perfringens]|uniref:hypothetical protein n=1 Tax=Clostridium perfringens TaxID=1502 RepID=UPI0018E4AEDE|nr:hypothetical protein [Clostridium perfringens]MBI6083375.1 hypothetical protein [Clostridium perfringens]MDM0885548.1 hypothetical protein [Clostridium perfringens]HAT4301695.1 hypothetical protein [Clostridium perfringens]
MYKIVIVGLGGYRIEIKNLIADNVEIVAYSQRDNLNKKCNTFDYKPFVNLLDLAFIEYDFIVLADSNKEDIEYIKRVLKQIGIDSSNVIEYACFRESLCINPLKVFYDSEIEFDALLFGMSHSQCSVQPQLFSEAIYKFASPSMDLFCQYKLVQSLINEQSEKISKVSTFVFEFPYYIFNFDLSRFRKFVINRLYYFYIFSDYHHFDELEGSSDIIKQFEKYVLLFDKNKTAVKFSYTKEMSSEKNNISLMKKIKKILKEIVRIIQIFKLKDDVWYKQYKQTQNENIEYWKKIVYMIKKSNPNAQIKVLICPFDPLFRILNKNAIMKNKEYFYNVIGDSAQIYDFFSLDDDFKFIDHCHLDTQSGFKFCNHLVDTVFR